MGGTVDGEGVVKRLDGLRTTKGEWNARTGARGDGLGARERTRRQAARADMLVVRRQVWGTGAPVRAKIGCT